MRKSRKEIESIKKEKRYYKKNVLKELKEFWKNKDVCDYRKHFSLVIWN